MTIYAKKFQKIIKENQVSAEKE